MESVGASDDGALVWAIEHPDGVPTLSEIDPYGETIVSYRRLDAFLAEWNRLLDETTNVAEQRYVLEVRDVLERARQPSSGSVRFVGD